MNHQLQYLISLLINKELFNKITTQLAKMIQNKQHNTYSLKYFSANSPHLVYTPQPFVDKDGWYHPVLGYPMCPLIGRYNKGEYRIGDVAMHLQFICNFDENKSIYRCGQRQVNLPQYLHFQLRHIPEIIPYNKPKNLKNEPDVHLTHHIPQKIIKLNFIVSFGQIGNDFLNYLNHTYIFTEDVFFGDKLNRTTCNIPIIAYMPDGSNLQTEEVERGISITEWRSQYMSIHLKGGAPAFSPNNMRVGVKGGKKVVTKGKKQGKTKQKESVQIDHRQQDNENKDKKGSKGKKKYKLKDDTKNEKIQAKNEKKTEETQEHIKNEQKNEQQEQENRKDINQCKKEKQQKQIDEVDLFWEQIQKQREQEKAGKIIVPKVNKQQKQQIKQSHCFVHFYTAVLLEKDHRINYHWHIEDQHRQTVIKQLLKNTATLEDFLNNYTMVIGEDSLSQQLSRLLII